MKYWNRIKGTRTSLVWTESLWKTNLVFVFRLLEKYARVDGILETLRAEGGTQEQIEEVIKDHFFQN